MGRRRKGMEVVINVVGLVGAVVLLFALLEI